MNKSTEFEPFKKGSGILKDKNGNAICPNCLSTNTNLEILQREILNGFEDYEVWDCKDCGRVFKSIE